MHVVACGRLQWHSGRHPCHHFSDADIIDLKCVPSFLSLCGYNERRENPHHLQKTIVCFLVSQHVLLLGPQFPHMKKVHIYVCYMIFIELL